jgi:hypothetical protein
MITTSSSSARRALQKELENSVKDRDGIYIKLEAVTDSLSKLDIAVLNKETSNEAERELGPLKYISKLTERPMAQVINWLLLLIIFVFDPLAVSLIVAANFAFDQIRGIKKEVKMSVPKGLKYNTSYTVEEVKAALPKEKPAEKPKDEKEDIYDEKTKVTKPISTDQQKWSSKKS